MDGLLKASWIPTPLVDSADRPPVPIVFMADDSRVARENPERLFRWLGGRRTLIKQLRRGEGG